MSGRIKHSANEGSTGPKLERVLKNPDDLDGLWVYTDRGGKPYFAAGRGEGRDTPKAYEIYTIGPPDSLEDQEMARADHHPYRSSWVQVGGLNDSIREIHSISEGKSLPYRFKDLLALPLDSEVFITEGERDAENLWRIGCAATCVEGTMTSADRHDWQDSLSGHPVTAINDADLRGLQRVQQIVKSVKALSADNKAKTLRVLPIEKAWYDCPENGDITDFLSAKASELDDMRGDDSTAMADRWAKISRCVFPDDWKQQLLDDYCGKSDRSGGAGIAGVGPIGMGDTRGQPDDKRLLDYLKKQFLKLMDRAEDPDDWAVYAKNEITYFTEIKPDGYLSPFFILDQDGKGQARIHEVMPREKPNPKITKGKAGPQEAPQIDDAEGYLIAKLREAKAYWGVYVQGETPAGNPTNQHIADYWFKRQENPARFHSMRFDPNQEGDWEIGFGKCLRRFKNTFRPPHQGKAAFAPPEDYDWYLRVLERNLPIEGDKEVLVGAIAAAHQQPGTRLLWIVSFQGGQGSGKGSLVKAPLQYKFGGFMANPSMDTIFSKFRGWLRNSVVWVVDEAAENGMKDIKDAAKRLDEIATEQWLSINEKNEKEKKSENFASGFILTNIKRMMMSGKGVRRIAPLYSALQTSEQIVEAFPEDHAKEWKDEAPDIYDAAMEAGYADTWWGVYKYWYEMHGGAEAVRYFFESVAIAAKPGRAPETSVKDDADREGRDDWERVLLDAIDRGEEGFVYPFVSMNAVDNLFSQELSRWRPNGPDVGKLLSGDDGEGYESHRPRESYNEIARFGLVRPEGTGKKFNLYCACPEMNKRIADGVMTLAMLRNIYDKTNDDILEKEDDGRSKVVSIHDETRM